MTAAWLIEALIASTVLMVLVLLIRAPVRNTFGPQLGYALWALPVLRLVLPPLPDAWRQVAVTPISRASETITIFVADGGAAVQAGGQAVGAPFSVWPTIGLVVAIAWGAGAFAFLVWHLASHKRFCRRLLGSAAAVTEVRGVHVIASNAAPGPLAFGIVRRYVAFPLDFADRYDADERELALEHEIGHHQRGDLIANWVALSVLAIHWFNPIAWRAFHGFRADQELANDARVLAGRSTIDRHAYACAIVKAAHGGAVSAACHLHTIDDLKGRIRMLSTSPRSRRRLATGGALVSILVMAGLGLTASGTSAAAALTGKVGRTIGVDLQAAPPAPPAPPAVPTMAPMAEMPQMPDIPEVPPVKSAQRDLVVVKRVAKDGKISTYTRSTNGQYDDRAIQKMVDDSMRNTPEVTSRRCVTGADGGPQQYVMTRATGNKRAIVICTNRIGEAAAAGAAAGAAASANAGAIRSNALATALASVEASRASIAANRDMADADRKEALADMDQAIAEIRAETASTEND